MSSAGQRADHNPESGKSVSAARYEPGIYRCTFDRDVPSDVWGYMLALQWPAGRPADSLAGGNASDLSQPACASCVSTNTCLRSLILFHHASKLTWYS